MPPDPVETPTLRDAQAVLAAQPFAEVVGGRLTEFRDGRAELRIPLEQRHQQHDGVTHGGVISYAADNVLTFAAGAAVGRAVLTAGYSISFLSPADGDELIARAQVVRAGSRQVTVRADVFVKRDQEEHLCAVAQGTVARHATDEARRDRPGAALGRAPGVSAGQAAERSRRRPGRWPPAGPATA